MRTQRRAYLFQRCIFGGKLDWVSRFFVGLQKVRKMDCEDARKNENMQKPQYGTQASLPAKRQCDYI